MVFKVSFEVGRKRGLSKRTFKTKSDAKKAVKIAITAAREQKGKYGALYKKVKNPRVVKVKELIRMMNSRRK